MLFLSSILGPSVPSGTAGQSLGLVDVAPAGRMACLDPQQESPAMAGVGTNF